MIKEIIVPHKLISDLLDTVSEDIILLYNSGNRISKSRKFHMYSTAPDLVKICTCAKNEGADYVCYTYDEKDLPYMLIPGFVAIQSTSTYRFIGILSIDHFYNLLGELNRFYNLFGEAETAQYIVEVAENMTNTYDFYPYIFYKRICNELNAAMHK